MTDVNLLVGDIGGTNARFAIARPGQRGYERERVLQCDDFNSAESAIQHYLKEIDSPSPQAICLAVAGPVSEGRAKLTNNKWEFDEKHLSDSLSCARVQLLNDFEAMALGLVELDRDDVSLIGSTRMPDVNQREFVMAVVGPGTGLGAASLVKKQDKLFALGCEAGHAGFSPESELQVAIMQELATRFGRVSGERLVSGTGLVNLYSALAKIKSTTAKKLTAAEIFGAINQHQLARESVDLFFELLGQVSGNFVLSTGAFDGLFIGGGIVPRYPELLQHSGFREGFENKGRHRSLMQSVPTALVAHPYPGLLGAASSVRSGFAEAIT